MDRILGFIGSGNMGQAMLAGILKSNLLKNNQIIVSDLDEQKLKAVAETYGVRTTTDSRELAARADIIILAVKPNIYDPVIRSIKDVITDGKIIVTIAAGKSIASVEAILGTDAKIIRTMPNTPALVSEGMSALCCNKNVTPSEQNEIKTIYESFGQVEIVPENLIDSVIGISGSSPAFVFMFIEALADAGVVWGLPRAKAYKLAAQAVLGSAKMVLVTGKHPGELKDMVCSPGGTTIEAVSTLENEGFRAAVIKAVADCVKKAKEMNESEEAGLCLK
ncbi:MAG TPA: pyrroline-5-carboxylate reductase [Selenomonadales bacterium]|nr:pyrroline-5-carboxylate reductase [Selenomonadales bacterium]